MTNYELIIRFSSDTPFYEIRSYMVDSLLNEFQNLNMWDLKREQDGLIEKQKKQISDLEKENEQIKNSDTLCKLIGEQKRKIVELEAQIEKMKCCQNCHHRALFDKECTDCLKFKNWKLRSYKNETNFSDEVKLFKQAEQFLKDGV